MFLKEFAITRYGPLSGGEIKRLEPFTLFFAPNEEGKTLTIDALLKMMFSRRELIPLDGVGRVAEKPDGYLVIGTEQEEFKLPDAGRFSALFEISANEFRNTFLIRDSDLSLMGEEDFYRGISGRLTGMRTADMKKTRENLQLLGGITAGGDFVNTAPDKLKDRYLGAQKLLADLEVLLDDLEAENFSRHEEELARLEERQQEVKNLLDSYNVAFNRERLEKGREALERLRKAQAKLGELKQFKREDYESWQRSESNRDYLRSEFERLEKERLENREQLRKASEQKNEKKENLKRLEYNARLAKEKIEPALEQHDRAEAAAKKENIFLDAPFVKMVAAASVLSFFVALAGYAVRQDLWLLPVLLGSFSAALIYSCFRVRAIRRKAELNQLQSEVLAEAEKIDIPAVNIRAVRAALTRLDRDLEPARETLEEAERQERWLEKELSRLKDELRERAEKMRQEEDWISGISFFAGVDSLTDYYLRLEEKQALKGEIEKQTSILKSHFGSTDENQDLEEQLYYWQQQVDQLESFAGRAKNFCYEQVAVDQLRNELDLTEGEIDRIRQAMARHGDRLRSLEKEVNTLFAGEGNYLPCQTTVDLEAVRQKVKQWLEAVEHRRNKALAALEVLNCIAVAEEKKVSSLFGEGRPVSRHFEAITDGRYRKVEFDSVESRVKVLSGEARYLDARSLSGGAYDQLYFSIRLALGESLFRGGKGFFILDDPFIKADGERLKKMLSMLGEISREGWQVVYFSAKDEVMAALEKEREAGAVKVCML